MVPRVRSRWTDIPKLRTECAELLAQNLNSGFIAEELNAKYGAQMRKLGYGPLNRNMIIGEKHRERIKARRLDGTVVPRVKGKRAYLVKAEPPPKPALPTWMNKPLYDAIRIKPRNERPAQDVDEEVEEWT